MLKTTYPAVIAQTANGFSIDVPQFQMTLESNTPVEAIQVARKQICKFLIDYVNKGEELPISEPLAALQSGSTTILIDIDMIDYMSRYGGKKVRKNVCIPAWLDTEAKKKGMNLSKTLQNAILYELGYKQ